LRLYEYCCRKYPDDQIFEYFKSETPTDSCRACASPLFDLNQCCARRVGGAINFWVSSLDPNDAGDRKLMIDNTFTAA
jgi:hypothetical protein